MRFTYYLKKIPKEVTYVILLFFFSRIVLTIIGVLARMFIQKVEFTPRLMMDIWGVWDSVLYVDIANRGYATVLTEHGYERLNFFPLYPMLMRFFGKIVGDPYLAGLIISNICMIGACILLYRLFLLGSDSKTALRSVKYLFVFPTAVILSGVFSESLFLFLAIACFYYGRKRNWFLVGVFGFLLSLTRPHGVLVFIPLAYEYLKEKNFRLAAIRWNVLFLCIIPLGLLAFAAYNYYLSGDALAFMHVKTAWGHHVVNPFSALFSYLRAAGGIDRFNSVFALGSLLLLLIFFKTIGFSYWFFGIYSILIPLSSGGGQTSLARYVLVIFPLYLILAKITKNEYVDQGLTIALALLQGFLMVFWTTGSYLVV